MSTKGADGEDGNGRRGWRALVLLAGAGGSAFLIANVALALWSTTATGSASAKAATAQTLTVTAAPSPTADLYPGASGAVQFSVTNPNAYAVSLTSVSYSTVISSDQTNCPASNLSVGAGGTLATPIAVPGAGSSGAVSIPAAVTLSTSAPNGCQGVTFTVALTLTGSQV